MIAYKHTVRLRLRIGAHGIDVVTRFVLQHTDYFLSKLAACGGWNEETALLN